MAKARVFELTALYTSVQTCYQFKIEQQIIIIPTGVHLRSRCIYGTRWTASSINNCALVKRHSTGLINSSLYAPSAMNAQQRLRYLMKLQALLPCQEDLCAIAK